MKKVFIFIILLFVSFVVFAQEGESSEGTETLAEEVARLADEVTRLSGELERLGTNGRLPFNFRVYSKAEWAPFVYKADIDNDSDTVKDGPGFGVGSGPAWDGIGAVLGLEMWGSGANDKIGFALNIRAASGDGNIYSNDNIAYLWAKPFGDALTIQMGRYVWSHLEDKINSWEQDIFQSVSSHTFGALFVYRPSFLNGLLLFGSWGVSGTLDNGHNVFAANTEKGLHYVLTSPQAGIAFEHESFGLARFQYIPSSYIYGDGQDWFASQSNIFWSTFSRSLYWLPARAHETPRFEFALNLTRIPNFFIDMGFGFALPVQVVLSDLNIIEQVGPKFTDRGYRAPAGGLSTGTETRIAHMVGDKWLPPMKATLKLHYLPSFVEGLGFSFSTKVEFNEQVAFDDGSDNFFGGTRLQFGLSSWKHFQNNISASLGMSLRVWQDDSFNGKYSPGFSAYNKMAMDSLNNNGIIDMGLEAFVSKSIMGNGNIGIGIRMSMPLGGARYTWYDDDYTGVHARYFSSEITERYKKGRTVIMIPIIMELNLY